MRVWSRKSGPARMEEELAPLGKARPRVLQNLLVLKKIFSHKCFKDIQKSIINSDRRLRTLMVLNIYFTFLFRNRTVNSTEASVALRVPTTLPEETT